MVVAGFRGRYPHAASKEAPREEKNLFTEGVGYRTTSGVSGSQCPHGLRRVRHRRGAITKPTRQVNLIKMLWMDQVSLNGSPTVSPVTAALWASNP